MENYKCTGSTPLGITINKNKTIANATYGNIISFNNEHKLILGKYSSSPASSQKEYRDCVSF